MTDIITERDVVQTTGDEVEEVDDEEITDDEAEPTDLGVIQQHG